MNGVDGEFLFHRLPTCRTLLTPHTDYVQSRLQRLMVLRRQAFYIAQAQPRDSALSSPVSSGEAAHQSYVQVGVEYSA